RLDLAVLAGKAGMIPARGTVEWYLNITLGVVEQISRISKEGEIFS
ncbi:MAG: hypothetical protein GYA12_01220, partial [Chloroflexi bacterium]|nr:hypothetical protein [Chloroflexota bacterium]